MVKKTLYIISNKQSYIDKLKDCLNFDKYKSVKAIFTNNGNTIASYIRTVRLLDGFDRDIDDMLVVYQNDNPHLTDLGSVYYVKQAAYIGESNKKHYCVHCVSDENFDSHIKDIKQFVQ